MPTRRQSSPSACPSGRCKEGGKGNSAATGVPRAHLDLVRQNREELQRINTRLDALAQAQRARKEEGEDDDEEEPT